MAAKVERGNQAARKAAIKGDIRFYGTNSKEVRAWKKRERKEQEKLKQLFIASGSLHIVPDKIIRCGQGFTADVEIWGESGNITQF